MSITKPTFAAQRALEDIHIKYRRLDLPKGSLYFCEIQEGLTFDLFETKDGRITLWRYVGSISDGTAVKPFEFHRLEYPNSVVGYHVNEEGDICFYASRLIDETERKMGNPACRKLIAGFIRIIILMSKQG